MWYACTLSINFMSHTVLTDGNRLFVRVYQISATVGVGLPLSMQCELALTNKIQYLVYNCLVMWQVASNKLDNVQNIQPDIIAK